MNKGLLCHGRYLRVSRVALLLDCNKDKVYELIKNGKLKAIKFGIKSIRISEHFLQAFIDENRLDPESYFS